MFKSAIYNRAYKLACMSDTYPFKTSAIVFKSKRILAEGINEIRPNIKVDNKYKRFSHSLHAEAAALANFKPKDLKGSSILILRINAHSKRVSTGKPCSFCQQMMYDYGLKYAYVSDSRGNITKYEICKVVHSINIPVDFSGGHNYENFFLKLVEEH